MTHITRILLLLTALVVALLPHLAAGAPVICEPAYSKQASTPRAGGEAAITTEFPSPDGLKTIVMKDRPKAQPEISVRIGQKEFPVKFSPWPCPEFQWAPDSKAFFLTYSDGGAVGNYEVMVYYPSDEGVETIEPTSAVEKDFLAYYPKCAEPETPNLGGVAWVKDSRRLLVAAQVLPHSNCDMMGTFSLYEIEVPSGKIIKKYDQLRAKSLFGELLGTELRNADDDCFIKPGSCEIPMLHGK